MFVISLIKFLRRQPKGLQLLLWLFVIFSVSLRGSIQHLLGIMGIEVFVPVSSKCSYWNCNGCESAQQISLRSRCVKVTLSSALMERPVRETCVDFMARWRSPETERQGQRVHGWRWREKDVNWRLIFLFQNRPNGTVWRIVQWRQIFHSEGGETLRPSRVGLLLWT